MNGTRQATRFTASLFLLAATALGPRLLDGLVVRAPAGRLRAIAAWLAQQVIHVGAPLRTLWPPHNAVTIVLFGAMIWCAIVLQLAVLTRGIALDVPLAALILLYATLGLASVIPGAPGYLGTYQLGAVYALGVYGVGPEQAFVVATLYQLSRLLGSLPVCAWALVSEGPAALRRGLTT